MTAQPDAGGAEARGALVWSRIALALLLLGAVALALTVSFQRAFQVDEVEHVHATYNLRDGRMIYRDFWEGHNPLLYGLLAPFVDPEDPVGSFRRARIVPLVVFLGIVAVGVVVARRMAGETAAWLAAALLLTQSTLVERGLEVRPDGLLGLAALAAFAIETSKLPGRGRSAFAAGVLSLTFLATQKAAFLCAVFAVVWAVRAWRARRASLLIVPAAVGIAPYFGLLLWLQTQGALVAYWEVNVGDALRRVGRAMPSGGEFSPAVFLVREGRFNLMFSLLACATLGWGLWSIGRRRLQGSDLGLVLLSWLLVATLWLNPFPFPYLHASVLPVLCVAVAVFLSRWLESRAWAAAPERCLALATLVVVLAATTSMPRLASRRDRPMRPQMEVLSEIHRITGPTDAVFDLVGLYFRRDAYPVFTMTGVMLGRYARGGYPGMIPILEESAPAAVMTNYRMRALPPKERQFLNAHFVHHDGPIFVQGIGVEGLRAGETMPFRALGSREFTWFGEPGLRIDGMPFERGELSAGHHVLSADRDLGPGRLAISSAIPSRPVRRPFELYPQFD